MMNNQLERSFSKIFDGPLGKNPPPTSPITTKTMKSNKPKNSRPEINMRKTLFNAGIKGYRIHWDKVPGKPDIAFPGRKLAVFVYGVVSSYISNKIRNKYLGKMSGGSIGDLIDIANNS